MKRYATTVIAVLIAIPLAIYVWHDRNTVTAGERKTRENNVFSAWRRDDLLSITVHRDDDTVTLVRDPVKNLWRMTAPREERADQEAVERFITSLEFASVVRKVGAGDHLGFDHPRASGDVTMNGVVFHFALGAVSPRPEGSSYFKVDDGDPFVASKELTDSLLASSDTYRDRSVVPYLSMELAKFEVVHPPSPDGSSGFVVTRRDERSFDVPALGVLASRQALDKVWGALAEMRAEAFPKDADVDRLTATPVLQIRFVPSDKAKPEGELVTGGPCPGHPDDVVVLRKSPTRASACAPRGAIEALLEIKAEMLVDRHPFAFRHDEIEEIRWEPVVPDAGHAVIDAKPVEIARKQSGFHQREPEDRDLPPGESEAASELLVAIERTEATDVQRGGAPFTAGAKTRIWSGERDETIEVGPPEGDHVTLRRVRDDARLTVAPFEARRFVPRVTTVRSLVVLGETRRVTRVALRCGVSQDLADTGQGLKLTSPTGYETDGSITQLVDGLVRGKALAWTADRDDGSFGLKDDGCRAVLSFADGNTPATFRFGSDGAGGVYGNVDGDPDVFVAPAALRDMVSRIYVTRAALRVDPAQIEKVTGTQHGHPVEVDPSALGSLFADRVASLGTSDVGASDLELTIAMTEGGPPKRVSCGISIEKSGAAIRRCATPTVKAVFEVPSSAIDRLFRPAISDAGAPDAR